MDAFSKNIGMHNMSATQDSSPSIVVLTDNENETMPLVDALVQEQFKVRLQPKTKKQLDMYAPPTTDLLLIDSSRFSLEELSVYPRIRSVYSGLLMLLINNIDEMLQVLLYEHGVDDLLVKPANNLLIMAHIRALLRRKSNRVAPVSLLFNGLEINGGLRRVTYEGHEFDLTSREFDLLWYMAKNACTTLNRDQLYKAVLGIEYNGYDRSIDMYIARIRAKMAYAPRMVQMIKTVRGNGYLFAAEQ
jgi:two-component system response regulator RstA